MTGIRKIVSTGFKEEVLALFFAFKDARTPFYAKLLSLGAMAYLISPVDLLPDIIPFMGYIDDLVVVPVVLKTAFRFLPVPVKELALQKSRKHARWLQVAFWGVILLIIALMVLILMFLLDKI